MVFFQSHWVLCRFWNTHDLISLGPVVPRGEGDHTTADHGTAIRIVRIALRVLS